MKQKSTQLISGLLLSSLLLPSCATIISGSRQTVRLTGTPSGSTYYINDKPVEAKPVDGQSNAVSVRVPRKRSSELKVKHEGYKEYTEVLYPEKSTGLQYLNYVPFFYGAATSLSMSTDDNGDMKYTGLPGLMIMTGGLAGLLTDRMTGANSRLNKKEVQASMTKLPKAVAGSQSVQCTLMNVRVKGGDKLGNYFVEKEPTEILYFGKSLDTDAEHLKSSINGALKDIGYTVPDGESKSIFSAGTNSRYTLQGEMRDVKYNVHASSPYRSAHYETDCTVEVTWKLLNQSRQTVVEQKTTGASVKFEQGGSAAFEDAFENSFYAFFSNPEVAKALAKGPDTKIEAAAATTPVSMRRGAPMAADKGLSLAARSVVIVETSNGHGSGCIVSPDGYIVTNAHVVDEQQEVNIQLADGMSTTAKVVRLNAEMDLALLKVDAEGLTAFQLPTSSLAEIGGDVFAIGTPADKELGQTVTKGIISGRRKVDGRSFLQTDVSINGGNSGGALVARSGQLLGIVNAKLVGRGIEGIGFAIPAEQVAEALNLKFTN
ncbi:S1C family serine protease [Hymenobacter yonginensis]|uniref:Trypsin-like peptidase domain-containing protein n=1 Tax=Hymenobacter yonginensis TaxID=748197 RepID=A0ABY7PU28_9BACT|nr:trypsin-like peptidase domain-containing protein [Hymenobacter yonginensis]WBO86443.1 trypsin-like peptidase domain-containing protein [Hymenobacter yonginensis]